MKKITVTIILIGSLLHSCTSDSVKKTTTAPMTYEFTRDGASTVNFNGQTTRILMATEISAALLDNTGTETSLDAMFAHQPGVSNFSSSDLNSSDKNVRSKVAASSDYFSANSTLSIEIKTDFETWIANQVSDVFPNWDQFASAGVAGQIQEAGGGPVRYVNAKGLEYNQAFAKGLIGGLMVDQMLNNYLSSSVLDAGSNVENNNNGVLEEGKVYTTMEHKWDEAYGYLYGLENDPATPQLGVDNFLNKYVASVDGDSDFFGIAQDIYDAFKLGRAAIVAKDYELRDEQVALLREYVSKVVAVRAIYYLQGGKLALASNDFGGAFHDLSEGFGFIYSLQFTRMPSSDSPYFSNTEVNGFISQLMEGNGFWDVSEQTLDSISEAIATRFNITVSQAAN